MVLTNSDQLGLPLLFTYEHKFHLHSLNNGEMEEVSDDYILNHFLRWHALSLRRVHTVYTVHCTLSFIIYHYLIRKYSQDQIPPLWRPGSPPSHRVCRFLQRAAGRRCPATGSHQGDRLWLNFGNQLNFPRLEHLASRLLVECTMTSSSPALDLLRSTPYPSTELSWSTIQFVRLKKLF